MTAETASKVYELVLKDPVYESILIKFMDNNPQIDDFRQHLWLILLELPDDKVVDAWNGNWFKYLYVRIITNQIKSNTSPWHVGYRKHDLPLLDEYNYMSEEDAFEKDKEIYLELMGKGINKFLNQNPCYKRDFELLKMKYIDGHNYREISEMTMIPLGSVYKYVQTALMLLENYMKQKIQI